MRFLIGLVILTLGCATGKSTGKFSVDYFPDGSEKSDITILACVKDPDDFSHFVCMTPQTFAEAAERVRSKMPALPDGETSL